MVTLSKIRGAPQGPRRQQTPSLSATLSAHLTEVGIASVKPVLIDAGVTSLRCLGELNADEAGELYELVRDAGAVPIRGWGGVKNETEILQCSLEAQTQGGTPQTPSEQWGRRTCTSISLPTRSSTAVVRRVYDSCSGVAKPRSHEGKCEIPPRQGFELQHGEAAALSLRGLPSCQKNHVMGPNFRAKVFVKFGSATRDAPDIRQRQCERIVHGQYSIRMHRIGRLHGRIG